MNASFTRLIACTALLVSGLAGAASGAQHLAYGHYPVPTFASGPWGIVAGPDGALWFTEDGSPSANHIGRITVAGTVTEFPIPTPSSAPNFIAGGPDGALWFTELAGNNIGRITTAGAITEYPLPAVDAEPQGITTGPDGALWFAEHLGNKIGRITTTGAITEFPVPSADAGVQGITAGPDGALWFTEYSLGKIGRIATTGVVTEYPVGAQPETIVTGPDGALWFTEFGANKIGRITTSGRFTEFAVPVSNFDPLGLTVGSDGKLWFTSGVANLGDIGSITKAGVIATYHIPGGSAQYITTGPDGALWFSESGANKIGQAIFASATLSVSPASGAVGTSLTFTGGSFAPNEMVDVYTEGVGSAVLVSGMADANGSFTATAPAPPSVNEERGFLAAGQTSGKVTAASFKVLALITLDPDSGPVHTLVTVTGSGFQAGEPIEVQWTPRPVSSATADASGNFSASFRVPGNSSPGDYKVVAGTTGSGARASATFTVQ